MNDINIEKLLDEINSDDWSNSKITTADSYQEAKKLLKQINYIANKSNEMDFRSVGKILQILVAVVLKGKEVELEKYVKYFYYQLLKTEKKLK